MQFNARALLVLLKKTKVELEEFDRNEVSDGRHVYARDALVTELHRVALEAGVEIRCQAPVKNALASKPNSPPMT